VRWLMWRAVWQIASYSLGLWMSESLGPLNQHRHWLSSHSHRRAVPRGKRPERVSAGHGCSAVPCVPIRTRTVPYPLVDANEALDAVRRRSGSGQQVSASRRLWLRDGRHDEGFRRPAIAGTTEFRGRTRPEWWKTLACQRDLAIRRSSRW